MYYIQRKDKNNLETIDEAKTRKEANYLRYNYVISDNYSGARYYISSRCCNDWKC